MMYAYQAQVLRFMPHGLCVCIHDAMFQINMEWISCSIPNACLTWSFNPVLSHVCIYVCMHACMYVCLYVCMYAYPHASEESASNVLLHTGTICSDS
jgi:hypothetical protein